MRILLLALIFTIGCKGLTRPERENYKIESCYRADLCHWENANLKDGAALLDCTDVEKECRALEKYIFCSDNHDKNNRWKNHEPDDCWKQLNQK
ncbi:MAG TPA: hypothetical protein VMZ04_03725 [Anaerolineae bacterium]|nr:hypothetical protein [Anaerolineae bacterium]